jgi:dUTP pyrophosphatase
MASQIRVEIKVLAHGEGLEPWRYHSAQAAGADIRAALPEGEELVIEPGRHAMVESGFAMALPAGYEAQIRPRSGLAAKYGVSVLNSPGTIDADYRGEVRILLVNHGQEPFIVRRGMRIAQMVIAPVIQARFEIVMELGESERSSGGFGSTGSD